jgi:hypothetical protein
MAQPKHAAGKPLMLIFTELRFASPVIFLLEAKSNDYGRR